MILTDLPNEILLMILMELQPNYIRIIDDLWTLPTNDFPPQRYINSKTKQELKGEIWEKRYHKTIHISYRKRPILLLVSHVCQSLRQVAFMHPIFKSLELYRFLAKPADTSISIRPTLQLSQWIQTISKLIKPTSRLHTIVLDPIVGNQKVLAKELVLMLQKVIHAESVQELVLMLGWLELGDQSVINEICRFQNVKKLYLRARQDESFHGFDNRALKLFSKSFTQVTHLFIQGYGRGSFSWNSLKRVLAMNPGIRELSIGLVRDEIDLHELGMILTNLDTLTIQFDVYDTALSYHRYPRIPTTIEPIFKGCIKDVPSLKTVYFHASELVDIKSIVSELLQGSRYENNGPKYILFN